MSNGNTADNRDRRVRARRNFLLMLSGAPLSSLLAGAASQLTSRTAVAATQDAEALAEDAEAVQLQQGVDALQQEARTAALEPPAWKGNRPLPLWDGKTGMTSVYFNKGELIEWRERGGDWLDADAVPHGPRPYVTMLAPSGIAPYVAVGDVTTLVRRLQTFNGGITLKFSDSTKVGTRTNADPAWRPKLILKAASGSRTVLQCAASQNASGSSSPVVGTLAGVNASRAMWLQFPIRPDMKFVSAHLELTMDRRVTVSVFELWQPRVFDFDAAQQVQYGIAAKYTRDQGIVRDPDVYFADDFSPWPAAEAEWRKTFYHGRGALNRSSNIDPTGGPFGGPCFRGVILTGVSGSNISRRHEWSRLHMSGIGKVTKRFNPYNGLRTTLDHPSGGRPDSSHPGAPEELYFRFYFWNDENRMDCRIEGDKVPGIFGQYGMYWNSVGYYEGAYGNGGAPTNGRRSHKGGYSGWTMRQHMQLRPSDGNPLGNQLLRGLGTYAYHCDQQGSWGDLFPYGTEETGRVLIGPNQWVCIEQRVKVNAIRGLTIAEQTARIAAVEAEKAEKTAYYQARHEAARRAGKNPTGYEDNIAEWSAVPVPVYDRNGYDQWGNGEAVRDGILEAWINGVKVYSRTNVAYRRHPSIKVDGVWFDHLHGGNYDAEHDHEFAEANIVVARKYIGPIR